MHQAHSRQYDGKVRNSFSPAARYAGFAMIFFGSLAFVSSLINLVASEVTWLQLLVGPAVLVAGGVMVSSYEGITLDAQTRRYRIYDWSLGFRRGEWLSLPNVVGINVSPFNSSYVLSDAIAPSITVQRRGLYRVLLSIEHSRIGIVAAIEKQDTALQKAAQLEKLFGVKVTSTLKI